MDPIETRPVDLDEPPPIGRTWNRIYAIVLIALGFEILLFYWFTRAFA